jgi:hypothetical protein
MYDTDEHDEHVLNLMYFSGHIWCEKRYISGGAPLE